MDSARRKIHQNSHDGIYSSSSGIQMEESIEMCDYNNYMDDVKLRFNICGEKFEVFENTVQKYPNTLLADPQKRKRFWDEKSKEYFLDRNRACFESVLTYYQTNGILIRPLNVPDVLFHQELNFYGLEEGISNFNHNEEDVDSEPKKAMPYNKLQKKVWNLFENPESSRYAQFVAWLSCTVVLVSIAMFCIETIPQFKEYEANAGETKSYQIFFIVEATCISWFTFEYIIRLLSSPSKWTFVREPLNIIDLIAILPFFIVLLWGKQGSNVSSMAIVRAARLVRVFRIFKLSRYSAGLQILGMTLRASLAELGVLVFFVSVGVVLFSSAIYYAELHVEGSAFHSIPESFWWAIVTMTTVGYGDMYPTTIVGKIVGSACACTGILVIALPVPVIVANFERFYRKAMKKARKSPNRTSVKNAAMYKAMIRFFGRLKRRNKDSVDNNGKVPTDYYYDIELPSVWEGERASTDADDV